jgi:hypothetical protein
MPGPKAAAPLAAAGGLMPGAKGMLAGVLGKHAPKGVKSVEQSLAEVSAGLTPAQAKSKAGLATSNDQIEAALQGIMEALGLPYEGAKKAPVGVAADAKAKAVAALSGGDLPPHALNNIAGKLYHMEPKEAQKWLTSTYTAEEQAQIKAHLPEWQKMIGWGDSPAFYALGVEGPFKSSAGAKTTSVPITEKAIEAKLAGNPGASIFDVAGVAKPQEKTKYIEDILQGLQEGAKPKEIIAMYSKELQPLVQAQWDAWKKENPKGAPGSPGIPEYKPQGWSAANPLVAPEVPWAEREAWRAASPYQTPAFRGVGQAPRQMPDTSGTFGGAYFSAAPGPKAGDPAALANMYAQEYSSGNYGAPSLRRPQVQPLLLDTSKYFVYDAKGSEWSKAQEKAREAMKKLGKWDTGEYKGVALHNVMDAPGSQKVDPQTVYATFDPGTVRSRFAQFRPSEWGKNNLLASVAGLAAGSVLVLGPDGRVYDIGRRE